MYGPTWSNIAWPLGKDITFFVAIAMGISVFKGSSTEVAGRITGMTIL